jgi:DNA-binding XRE family transcriptional regulator
MRRFERERRHQIESRVPQRYAVQLRPQVDHVSLGGALRIEALEHMPLKVDAEGPAARVASVQRTGVATLRATAAQSRTQSEMVEHARHRQLAFHMYEVDVHVLAWRRAGIPQNSLAHRAGLHRTYISLLERGLRMPSLGVLQSLAKALKTTMVDLVGELERGN